ncbi:MAG: hypothetical protein ABIS67_00770 [Candidatus Eisenbacteria bacterium]
MSKSRFPALRFQTGIPGSGPAPARVSNPLRIAIRRTSLSVVLAPLALLASIAAPGTVRAATLYDAVLGFPEDQGWTVTAQSDPPASIVPDLGPEGLHLSTLHLASTGATGGGLWWSLDGLALDFTQDFAIEASVRIDSAPDHSVNEATGWPRPGYGIALSDVNRRFLWVGLGSGEVFLSHTAYGQYGSSNTVHASFNTTDQHHVYRIERGPGGVGAALRIDGALVLQLPTLGSADGSAGPSIYFGDVTFWANSESHTAWVRAFTPTLDVGPRQPSELLWAKTLGGAVGRSSVAYGAGAAGSLVIEVFDPAGRRVEHSRREVSNGETGRFKPAKSLRDGLYFYRLRLEPSAGREVEASGKFVLVR